MTALPLIRGDDLDLPIAWRNGEPVSRRQYLADVNTLCTLLPGSGPMLNVTADRYHFAVGLGAAMLRGQNNLLPPNHTVDTVARLEMSLRASFYIFCARHKPWPPHISPPFFA